MLRPTAQLFMLRTWEGKTRLSAAENRLDMNTGLDTKEVNEERLKSEENKGEIDENVTF